MAKKVIIVTGPIGSGKSTAIEHISNKGYPTLDLDKISNEIINSKESIKFLDNNFPGVIKNKKLDKASLADIVFSTNFVPRELTSEEVEDLKKYKYPTLK